MKLLSTTALAAVLALGLATEADAGNRTLTIDFTDGVLVYDDIGDLVIGADGDDADSDIDVPGTGDEDLDFLFNDAGDWTNPNQPDDENEWFGILRLPYTVSGNLGPWEEVHQQATASGNINIAGSLFNKGTGSTESLSESLIFEEELPYDSPQNVLGGMSQADFAFMVEDSFISFHDNSLEIVPVIDFVNTLGAYFGIPPISIENPFTPEIESNIALMMIDPLEDGSVLDDGVLYVGFNTFVGSLGDVFPFPFGEGNGLDSWSDVGPFDFAVNGQIVIETVVPAPGAAALAGVGLLGLAGLRRRMK